MTDGGNGMKGATTESTQQWCFEHQRSMGWLASEYTYILHIARGYVEMDGGKSQCGRRFHILSTGPSSAEDICLNCARSYHRSASRLKIVQHGEAPWPD